jgi:hypothetical protein
MKSVAALALGVLLVTCCVMPPSQAQTSQFKGLAAIARELSTRIAPKDEPLDLEQFIPAEQMESLLGTWSTFGAEHSFQNGVPNTVNVVIWHVTLTRFAASIGASCAEPRHIFHPRFAATLRRICTWPSAEAKSEEVLSEFWWSVMGHNAPKQEYEAWRDFFLGSYAATPAAETIADMTLAIAMNPYFLLHK